MSNVKLNSLELNIENYKARQDNNINLESPAQLFSTIKKNINKSNLQNPDSFNNNSQLPNKQTLSNPISFIDSSKVEFKTDNNLQNFLSQKMNELGLKNAGVVLMDLNNGHVASVNGDKAFYPASVIKLPVMTEAFHQAANGKISMDQIITVKSENVVGTWQPDGDNRPLLDTGTKVSVRKLVELMITRSDNTATNVLIDVLGRKNITNYMKMLGLNHIEVNRKLSVDSDSQATGRNTMTSNDTAKLLTLIGTNKLINEKSSHEMLNILGGQLDNDKIPAGLPTGAKTFHKTGETSETCHDAAIVKYGNKTYIMTVFTNMPPDSSRDKIVSLANKISHLPEFSSKS